MLYKEVEGDLIELAKEGDFDVIAHGCNCMCKMKSGLAPQMAKTFGINKLPRENFTEKGNINKLGVIEFKAIPLHSDEWQVGFINKTIVVPALYVVNAYTQFNYGLNHEDGEESPLNYHALTLCLTKINYIFRGKKIGLPRIGCGLAGGDWKVVKMIIKSSLIDCDVTVVTLKKDKLIKKQKQ